MHTFFHETDRDHLLGRLDARVKLLSTFALLAMILTYKGYFFPLLVTALSFTLCLALRQSPKRLFLRFSEPAFIVVVLIVIKCFFTGRQTLWTFHVFGLELVGHRDGLIDGLLIGCRIVGGVSLVAALSVSTRFTELLAALAWLRVPKGFIEVSVFAYRYIFLLLDDAMVIYGAQKNRLGYSTVRRGLSSFGVLAGSLTLKAFDNSQHASLAMIQRGYDGRLPLVAHRPLKVSQVALSMFFLCLMGIAWTI
jgi:cobalt/nickel transport system permease protein